MDVRVGLWRKLSAEELMLLKCGVGEDSCPLDCKKIQPVHPKGNLSWIFIGRSDSETETPILWPPNVKSWLIRKDPDARKAWWQEEKGMTEDEVVGWHHWFSGHEFEKTLGVGDGQGGLACCGPWGHKVSDLTEGLNWLTPKSTKPACLIFVSDNMIKIENAEWHQAWVRVSAGPKDMILQLVPVMKLSQGRECGNTIA